MKNDDKPNFRWWLRLVYAVIGAILGLLGEATTGVMSAAINAL